MKVIYTEHLLSSSSSFENKEVLANNGGRKIEGKWVKSLENFMASLVAALEHGTCYHLDLQLGNLLVSESCQYYESSYSF